MDRRGRCRLGGKGVDGASERCGWGGDGVDSGGG